jgi:RimJ/RimL family protein N-acetyltransferase
MTLLLAPEHRSDEVRAFIMARAGVPAPKGPTQVLGFIDQKTQELVGGWMFERYTGPGGSVHAHWAASDRGWLSRTALNLVAMYLFDQLGVAVVFGEVRASETYISRVVEKLGFTEVARLKGYFPGDDLLLYSLLRENCRWLPEGLREDANGQEEQGTEGS